MRPAVAEGARRSTGLSYTRQVLGRAPRAEAFLMPNGGHYLVVVVRHLEGTLDRDHAEALATALERVSDEDALTLMRTFSPGVKPEDVVLMRRALEGFAEWVAVEERSGVERTHRAIKPLEI